LLYAFHFLLLSTSQIEVLIVGRTLAGISKVLLFTVFEAWMVHEHYALGYNDYQLRETFNWAAFINGVAAISSGIILHVIVPYFGLQSPYLLSVVLLAMTSIIIISTWPENYGTYELSGSKIFNGKTLLQGFTVIIHDPHIFCLGLMQTLFESAVFVFIFVWPPALERTLPVEIPYGLIFSCLVLSMMVGSLSVRILNHFFRPQAEIIAVVALAISAASLGFSAFTESFDTKFIYFNLFEFTIGIYLPITASLRHQYIPSESRSTILSLFRVPLSLLIMLFLQYVDILPLQATLIACAISVFFGLPCLCFLYNYQPRSEYASEISSLLS